MLEIIQGIFDPFNLLLMNLGVFIGIIVGVLPGLTGVFAITVLLPFTFGMDSIPGMYLLLGAYCGGSFGGSITAILINTPGTPAAAATVIDGYEMAKNGRAGDALKCALVASTIGGLFSCFALLFIGPALASFALKFGPPEYFALCIFGLTIVIGIAEKNILKGLMAAGLGLLLSTVGIDTNFGTPRFMFGKVDLLSGVSPIIVMLGIFALSEMLEKTRLGINSSGKAEIVKKAEIKIKDILKHWVIILKSSIFGTIIGAVPGTGGAIAAFFSYNEARRSSKTPERFGTGIEEGVLAPEAANNAVTGATLIPLLTLGIPGDIGAAVLMSALMVKGVIPGPELFTQDKFWVYSIMLGLFIINIFMFVQGNLLTRIFSNVTKVSFKILIPCVMVLCTVGAFSMNNSIFDVFIMIIFGFVGYLMRRFNFPLPPLTIGMVLGMLTETNLQRSLIMSNGSMSIFFTRPLSVIFLIIALLSLFTPFIKKAKNNIFKKVSL
jgi:putative tricarboxylic transport membrane protein